MAGFVRSLRRKPLQRRVTLLTTLAVALAVILSSVAGYVALTVTLYHASQDIAISIADDLAVTAAEDIRTTGGLTSRVRQAGSVVVEAVKTDGTVLRIPGEQNDLVLQPTEIASGATDGGIVRRVGTSTTGQPYVIVAVSLPDSPYALVVARSLAPVNEILRVQRWILLCVSLATIVVAALVSGLVARSGLRPVRQLTAAVEHVTATRDLQPIAIGYAAGDLAVLAASFNQMLRSLSQMRDRQTRLVADAGHELRTPLTSLRTNVELLSSDLRRDTLSTEQKGAILGDVSAQLAELSDLVGDLVHLTRDESVVKPEPLDLRAVVETAVDRVRRRGQGMTFDIQLDPLYLVGERDSLERAVTNLLDNAVKWNRPGGTVRVRLEGNRLRVEDQGPGVPEADVPYVFDRFFRGETARKTHGTGLGLSIVAKAVEDHGGSVEVGRSCAGGAAFTVRLPGVTSMEALPQVLVPSR